MSEVDEFYNKYAEGNSTIMDNRDYCFKCDKEIPPGPDFCSPECELEASLIHILERLESLRRCVSKLQIAVWHINNQKKLAETQEFQS